ncbi:MAG: hypothetical protein HYS17_11585 [Micavibrio aeruginosavorus]|uniref:Uncharacterized protein n=1 Tax=Micavibrio aeruginosavorus TaxID=349221 RepID=A0A7T5R292_9BACT|nr:MAG: hypothetical protein HYS17_11585 [Micavibrio aeruginosavorus]
MLKKLWQARTTEFYSETRRFEDVTGVQGVAHTYRMPGDMPPLQLAEYVPTVKGAAENLVDQTAFKIHMTRLGVSRWDVCDPFKLFADLADKLIELNPALAFLDYDRQRDSPAICYGAMSGYSPEDIQHFINLRDPETRPAYYDPDAMTTGYIGELSYRCQQLFGDKAPLEWNPSPATVAHINSELDRLHGPSPLQGLTDAEKKETLAEAHRHIQFMEPASIGSNSVFKVLALFR